MSITYFPDSEEEIFSNIAAFSPIDSIVCPRTPLGDIDAETYLEYAKSDLKEEKDSSLVNALSNAKRSFHNHIDRLLFRYSLHSLFGKESFPNKVELLSTLEIVPSTLLRVFNRSRNAMEHDYAKPSIETVEGAIDLCELLLQATERFMTSTPGRVRVKHKDDDRDLMYLLAPGDSTINKYQLIGAKPDDGPDGVKYYAGNPFEWNPDEKLLKRGFQLNELPDEVVTISKSNRTEWINILKMYSHIARGNNQFRVLPDEPMVVFHRHMPMKIFLEFIEKGKNAKI